MTERKKPKKEPSSTPTREAASKNFDGREEELANSISADVLTRRDQTKKHIRDVQREIEDGARPKRGRFRL